MSYTPGPWENIYMNEEKNAVAFMPSTEQLADCLDKNKTLQANAFLISAAPDLLEACVKLYNNWLAHDEILVGRESTQFARDAIAKATGAKHD